MQVRRVFGVEFRHVPSVATSARPGRALSEPVHDRAERARLQDESAYRRSTLRASQLPMNCTTCTNSTMRMTAAQVITGSNCRYP